MVGKNPGHFVDQTPIYSDRDGPVVRETLDSGPGGPWAISVGGPAEIESIHPVSGLGGPIDSAPAEERPFLAARRPGWPAVLVEVGRALQAEAGRDQGAIGGGAADRPIRTIVLHSG